MINLTPDNLRAMKNGLFSERNSMNEVHDWLDMAFPDGPEKVAAITVMGLTVNTLLELLAQQLEEHPLTPTEVSDETE